MAKAKTLMSERSIKDCFIEIKGKPSFKSTARINNSDDTIDRGLLASDINVMSLTRKENFHQTSKITNCTNAGNKEEALEHTEDSGSSETAENQKQLEKKNQDEKGDDHISDYSTESFCSGDSYKGSDVTNVTPRSSLSGCSLFLHSVGLKYDKRTSDLIKSRRSGDQWRDENEDDEGLCLLGNELKYLSEEDGILMMDRRQLAHSGRRRNMSFTNEELRKIERENQLLLKKIMCHQKPQNKSAKPISGAPRTSSSAINRKRLQKKIEQDNMILLRRIQQVKPCAMPRASAPSCRLAMI